MGLFDKKEKSPHDHSVSGPVTEETAQQILSKLNLALELLCETCGPAAQARMHPKEAATVSDAEAKEVAAGIAVN